MVFLSSPQSSTASLFNKQICFSFILGRSNLNPDIIKIPPPRPCLVYNGNLNDRYITSVSIVRLLTPNSHARFSRVSNRRLHNARRIAHRLSNAVMFSPYTFFCSLQPFTTATNRSSSIFRLAETFTLGFPSFMLHVTTIPDGKSKAAVTPKRVVHFARL